MAYDNKEIAATNVYKHIASISRMSKDTIINDFIKNNECNFDNALKLISLYEELNPSNNTTHYLKEIQLIND